MKAPPDFREELHPEEIVRRPSRHPWLATLALVVLVAAIGILLRAVSGADARAAGRPAALERGGTPIANAPDARGERGAATRSSR